GSQWMSRLMNDVKLPVSFAALIQKVEHVEVPLIQRDYAQGRDSVKEVRGDFLGALYHAASQPRESLESPLVLDFVYGSVEKEPHCRFLPLDGQQRLTTLFLLHWYTAWNDGCLTDFRNAFWDGCHSRFS